MAIEFLMITVQISEGHMIQNVKIISDTIYWSFRLGVFFSANRPGEL